MWKALGTGAGTQQMLNKSMSYYSFQKMVGNPFAKYYQSIEKS
jgi:hypothetical protein